MNSSIPGDECESPSPCHKTIGLGGFEFVVGDLGYARAEETSITPIHEVKKCIVVVLV